jgi:POT family proton-dependent oligopeptide transporter
MSATMPIKLSEKTFFGQPRSLVTIFGVEMWERFSFYGMQGILLLYMFYPVTQGGLGMPQAVAVGIIGAYGGSVYLMTILGAWLSDRLFGSERVLFYAAVLVMAGHIGLAVFPGYVGLTIGLVLIALGAGGVKSNATSVVGQLYAPGDIRRDAGFSLYYLGINLGAFFGPLLTGLLQTTYGFHWGFGLAAVGMAFGLTQYTFGRRRLPASTREVPNPLPKNKRINIVFVAVGAVVVVVVVVALGLIRIDNLAGIIVLASAAAAVAYFIVMLTSSRVTKDERLRVVAFIPLFIASAAFWALYQQQFTVITVFANDQLNLNLFGWTMPVAWVQSINPVFIILLSGAFAALWTKLGTRQPSTPIKFAMGVIGVGIGFLLFLPIAHSAAHSAPLMALVGILFVFTISELLISPVGLSAATKLAPQAFRTQMIALLFLASALGTALSGELAKYYDQPTSTIYFSVSGVAAAILGGVLIALSPWVRKKMNGVK